MRPPTRSNNPPKYAEELLDSQFEDLCRDLFAREPGIKNCVRYGLSGQKQHGIDLLAKSSLGGAEVAQCKCYKEFDERSLRKAVDEFFHCKEHWQTWGITRFILMVGCPVNNAKTQDESEVQRKRFEEIGIIFDFWGEDSITEKLRPHPDLVENYIGALWVRKICGPDLANKLVSRIIGEPTSHGPLGELLAECADSERSTINEKFDGIRELARLGSIESAFDQIQEYLKSPQWSLLDPRSQGRGLRLASSLHLDHLGDVERAKEALVEAKRLAPEENYQVIEASIALRNEGREAALAIVSPPLNLDAWNFRLALLAEAGRFKEIEADFEIPLFIPNANSWRLGSLAKLFLGEFTLAKQYADLAFKESPKWYLVRLHAAKMAYLSALLPSFPMLRHIDWPIPPDRQYLRTDTASLEMLGHAEVGFKDILDTVNLSSADKMAIEGWRLGCIANDAARRQEAMQYARQLLERNGIHSPAIVWSLERGFDIDIQSLLVKAEQFEGEMDLESLQALCAALAQTGTTTETLTFLNAKRHQFERLNSLFPWRLLKVQLLEETGDLSGVEEVIREEANAAYKIQLQLAALKIRARKTDDSSLYIKSLLDDYEVSGNSQRLFDLYESLVLSGRSGEAIKWTADLLRFFPTSSALTLALQANFDSDQFSKCLEILDKHRDCFPNRRIPSRIVTMEIECLRQSGRIADAKQLAEELVRDEQSTQSLIALFQTQMTLADFKECVVTIRKLLVRVDITTLGILQMAAGIQLEDMSLAKECWREAVKRGLETAPEIATAVNLAFRLGLDEEVSSFMPKFFALAQEESGAIKVTDINDVKEMMSADGAHQAQATKTFNAAQVPSHLLANTINAPLAAILVENMRGATSSGKLHQHFPALIHPGNRINVWSTVPLEPGKVFMDVTSLYVAEEIGILELIESRCAPIYISSHVLEMIQDEILRITPHQPSLHRPREVVLSMVEKKNLGVYEMPDQSEAQTLPTDVLADFRRRVASIKACGGVVCDFMPPRDLNNDLIPLTLDESSCMLSCGDLVENLRKRGELNDEEAEEACRRLGESGLAFNPAVILSPKQTIVLEGGMAEQLAKVSILEALGNAFNLKVTRLSFENVQAEVASYQRQMSLAGRLKQTAEHLTRGVSKGIYKTLAQDISKFKNEDNSSASRLYRCLLDMLAVEDTDLAAVWSDDRYLLRFNHIGGCRMAGIYDVLNTLKSGGAITENQYFDYLMKLRAGNARYIPMESGEVAGYIQASQVVNNEVIETKRLIVIRRYMAAVFSDFGRIVAPVKTADGIETGEFMWVINALRAVSSAMAGLWQKTEIPDNEKEAKADWLLDNLYVPYHGAIEAATREAVNGNSAHGIANSILLMIQAGFLLDNHLRSPIRKPNARASYYNWISRRLIEPMIQINPEVVSRLAVEVEEILLKRRDGGMKKKYHRVMRRLTLQMVVDLPDSLLRRMRFKQETRSWLGIQPFGTLWGITAFGREFASIPFWRAIARALKGRSSVVTSEGSKQDFTLGPAAAGKDKRSRVRFTGHGLDRHLRVEAFALFSGDKVSQAEFLNSKKDLFDRTQEERIQIVNDIANTSDPGRRMAKFTDAKSKSAAYHYRQLCAKVKSIRAVETPDLLPPDALMLCAHLRLRSDDFLREDALLLSAERLLVDLGPARTIERMASLPILLAPCIVKAVNEMSSVEFNTLMVRLRRRVRHPLGKLHMLYIMALRGEREGMWLIEAIKLRDSLFADENVHGAWEAFQKSIQWTEDQMRSLESYRTFKGQTRLVLVWLHAAKLFDYLMLAGADCECMHKSLEVWSLAKGARLEAWNTKFYSDVMHPRFSDSLQCLVRGFGAILGALSSTVAEQFKLKAFPLELSKDKNRSTAIKLLRDHGNYFNSYESFMGGSIKLALLQGIEADGVQQVMPEDPSAIISETLADLNNDVSAIDSWHTLAMTLGDGMVSPEVEALLAGLFEEAVNRGLHQVDGNELLLLFLARRSSRGISDSLRNKVDAAVWLKFSVLRRKTLSCNGEVPVAEFNLLLGCLAELATVPEDEACSQRKFHQAISRLAFAWPEAVSQIEGLSGWPTVLPVNCQAGYWEAATAIRLSKG